MAFKFRFEIKALYLWTRMEISTFLIFFQTIKPLVNLKSTCSISHTLILRKFVRILPCSPDFFFFLFSSWALNSALSPFSTRRICSREQTRKWERFLLVRGEFFRQPILTNHVAGFLFSLRVARTNSPSGKRALCTRS